MSEANLEMGGMGAMGRMGRMAREMVTRMIHPTIRQVEPEEGQASEPVLEFVSSDETLDRYGSVILASGWELKEYLKNPVFLDSHHYDGVIRSLGRALVTEVREGKLVQRIRFAVEANPIADMAYKLYKGHFLNGVSVGFDPLTIERAPVDGQGKKLTDWDYRHVRQELLEVSAVVIPANPNALQNALREGAVESADLREAARVLLRIVDGNDGKNGSDENLRNQDNPRGQVGADGAMDDAAQWVRALYVMQRVLRRA